MLKLQIALPRQSGLGSPCILVRKPPEKGQLQTPKFVVDYRRLNSVTQRDRCPIPSISSVLDSVSQGKVFAKCNLVSGYWQISIQQSDQQHVYASGTVWILQKLTFGMKTATNTFQQSLNSVFADYLNKWFVVYVDENSVESDRQRSPCKLFVVVSETG